jgi:transposase
MPVMSTKSLFGDDLCSGENKKKVQKADGEARVKRPDRRQAILRPQVIDQLIPPDHRARAIVSFVDGMDLADFYAPIKSRGDEPGRPATDPAMLIALWLFATSEGVGSGRQLERLCDRDDAYRWICGGVQVNYHTLTDFRVNHGAALDNLMTQTLGVLRNERLVRLRRISQDGVRVRANAGAASFRSANGLKACLKEAAEQVRQAKALLDKDDATRSDKSREAAERAARDRLDRVKKAMSELKKLQASKETAAEAEKARASTTDPDARVMRMADNGYRPAFNMQLAVDTDTRAIVGVAVTNSGSDMGQITPMVEEVERRTGKKPSEWLVDGGYTSLADIQAAGEEGVKVLAPLPKPKSDDVDPHKPKENDEAHVAAWRKRMGTDAAKETYKLRAATSECTNADLRAHRGLQHLPVRGIEKALTVGLWMAITYNALLWIGSGAASL